MYFQSEKNIKYIHIVQKFAICGMENRFAICGREIINRHVTKSKNCSGFMKVDQILKVWSLLNPKIFISPK
jgi:hypothetical protein